MSGGAVGANPGPHRIPGKEADGGKVIRRKQLHDAFRTRQAKIQASEVAAQRKKYMDEIQQILEEERRPAHHITKPAQYFNPHEDLRTEVDEFSTSGPVCGRRTIAT